MIRIDGEVWINLDTHPRQRACFLFDVETGIIVLPPNANKAIERLKQLDINDPQSIVFIAHDDMELYLVND